MKPFKKIPLYKVRNFGDKLSVTIDFIRQNIGYFLKNSIYLFLPLSLILGIGLQLFTDSMYDLANYANFGSGFSDDLAIQLSIGVFVLLIPNILGAWLSIAFTYASMQYYRKHEEGLQGATLKDVWPLIKHALGKSFKLGLALTGVFLLFITFVGIIMSILIQAMDVTEGATGVFFILLLYLVIILASIPLALVLPVYIFEDGISVSDAITRGWRLGLKAFFPILGLLVVVGMGANIIQGITVIPWYLMFILKLFSQIDNLSELSFCQSPVYSFFSYVFAVLMSLVNYICMGIPFIALAYQYGSAAEEQDAISVDEDIENFEEFSQSSNDPDIDNFDKL